MGQSKTLVDQKVFKDSLHALNTVRIRQGLKPVDSFVDAVRGRSSAEARKTRRDKKT